MTSTNGPVVVLVGNPQPESRTWAAARTLGEQLAELRSESDATVIDLAVIDLAVFGPALLDWENEDVAAATAVVASASVLVVASPTYKATYTGLLKVFLDRFNRGDLSDVDVVVPLMTGGGPAHSLAIDVHLRPLLIELGASTPTAGMYLFGDDLAAPDGAIEAGLEREGSRVRALTVAS